MAAISPKKEIVGIDLLGATLRMAKEHSAEDEDMVQLQRILGKLAQKEQEKKQE